jgi:mono/diheme cytochrome c family protein
MKNILLLIILTLFLSCSNSNDKKEVIQNTTIKIVDQKVLLKNLKDEYAHIDTKRYLEQYIENIIKNGSSGLGFPSGDMKGGFAVEDDIEKIAHYVVTLSGKKCDRHEMAKKAEMFFTSNCGGCHGSNGKGLNGAFPDLTRPTLLGIQKRKEYLKYEIKKLSKKSLKEEH